MVDTEDTLEVLASSQIEKMSKRITNLDEIMYENNSFKAPMYNQTTEIGYFETTKKDKYTSISLTFGNKSKPSWLTMFSTDLKTEGLCALLHIKDNINNIISNGADKHELEEIGKNLTGLEEIKYDKNGIFRGNVKCDDIMVGKIKITNTDQYTNLNFFLGKINKPNCITVISTDLDSNILTELRTIRDRVKLAEIFEKATNKYERMFDTLGRILAPVGFMS